MNKLFLIFSAVLLISFISALTIYAGESTTLTLDKPFAYYSILNNQTPINLDITQEENNVTITLNKYSQEDNFTLVFFDIEKEVITQYVNSGGGGTRTITKEVIKEVPNYITEYVDNETIVENKTIEYKIIKEPNGTTWIRAGFAMLIIFILLWICFKTKRKDSLDNQEDFNTDERRFDEHEEYRKEES